MSRADSAHPNAPPRPTARGAMAAIEVLRLLGSASEALFAQAGLHAQLARMEWHQEKRRLATLVAWAMFAMLCVGCTLLALGALALIIGWDSGYRIHIAVTVGVAYLLLAGIAGLQIKRLASAGEDAFAATRAELASDLAMLRSRL
jgi:uncharacterized membrane protein YqjE